jgi:hypothetical protein
MRPAGAQRKRWQAHGVCRPLSESRRPRTAHGVRLLLFGQPPYVGPIRCMAHSYAFPRSLFPVLASAVPIRAVAA